MSRPLRLLLAWLAAGTAGALLIARSMAYGLNSPRTRKHDDEEQRRALEEWSRDRLHRRRPRQPGRR